jgi:hypothetical protein
MPADIKKATKSVKLSLFIRTIHHQDTLGRLSPLVLSSIAASSSLSSNKSMTALLILTLVLAVVRRRLTVPGTVDSGTGRICKCRTWLLNLPNPNLSKERPPLFSSRPKWKIRWWSTSIGPKKSSSARASLSSDSFLERDTVIWRDDYLFVLVIISFIARITSHHITSNNNNNVSFFRFVCCIPETCHRHLPFFVCHPMFEPP